LGTATLAAFTVMGEEVLPFGFDAFGEPLFNVSISATTL
jgi:hypothetical protein